MNWFQWLKMVLQKLSWVFTYPIDIFKRKYSSHNERLAKRPAWLLQTFAAVLIAVQVFSWLAAKFLPNLPDFAVPLTVAVFMAFGFFIGERAHSGKVRAVNTTPYQIFGWGLFWSCAISLLIWWIF